MQHKLPAPLYAQMQKLHARNDAEPFITPKDGLKPPVQLGDPLRFGVLYSWETDVRVMHDGGLDECGFDSGGDIALFEREREARAFAVQEMAKSKDLGDGHIWTVILGQRNHTRFLYDRRGDDDAKPRKVA